MSLDRKINLRRVIYTKGNNYYTWDAIFDREQGTICAIRTYPSRSGGVTIKDPIEFKHKGGHDSYYEKLNAGKLTDGYEKEVKEWDGPLRDVDAILSEWYRDCATLYSAMSLAVARMTGVLRTEFVPGWGDCGATPTLPVSYTAPAAPVDKWAGLPAIAGSF